MTVYFLSREEILKAEDLRIREVEVPEWAPEGVDHATVRVRGLDGTQRDAYDGSMLVRDENGQMVPDMANMKVKLAALTIVDETGNPMFTQLDVGALGQKSAVALVRVYNVAAELSGMNPEAVTTAMGNSGAVPSDGSASS